MKPAASTEGHGFSKAELKKRAEDEKKLKGDSDLLEQAPRLLDGDPLARQYYFEVLQFVDEEVYGNIDRYGLGMVSMLLANIERTHNKLLNADGSVTYLNEIETKSGPVYKANPLITIQRNYMQEFNKMASQYGLSPSARAQLSSLTLENREKVSDDILALMNDDDEE